MNSTQEMVGEKWLVSFFFASENRKNNTIFDVCSAGLILLRKSHTQYIIIFDHLMIIRRSDQSNHKLIYCKITFFLGYTFIGAPSQSPIYNYKLYQCSSPHSN